MNKPIKPKKPTKNSAPPSKVKRFEKLLAKKNGKVELLDFDDYKIVDKTDLGWPREYIDWDKLESGGYEWSLEYDLTFSLLTQVHDILGHDFRINDQTNSDGYFEYWIIEYNGENPNFEKESQDYENRFKNYERESARYIQEIEKYEEFKKNQKIARLQKELKEIETSNP